MKPKTGDRYTHYKNPDNQYEIVCIAKDEGTLTDLVVYRALYPVTDLGEEFEKNPVFVRKIKNFMAILPNGKKRFEKS